MADRAGVASAKTHLRVIKGFLSLDTSSAHVLQPSVRYAGHGGRLISLPDAAINSRLQEQTRAVLASLTPRERQVLGMRFGIPRMDDLDLENPDLPCGLTDEEILLIEAKALRKLRQPRRSARLRSAVRV